MPFNCDNPNRHSANEQPVIADGARKITLSTVVAWGDNDLRSDYAGEYTFCSFACLSEWAAVRAVDHDGTVLVEGGDQ